MANQRGYVRKTKSAKTLLVKDIKVVLADQRGCVQKFFGECERIQSEKENLKTIMVTVQMMKGVSWQK